MIRLPDMNLLAVDQGNTFLKYAVCSAYDPGCDLRGHTLLSVEHLSEVLKQHSIAHAIVSSVASADKQANLLQSLTKLNISFIQLTSDTKVPIHNCYETPHTLGYDRLADAVGAWTLFKGKNSLVIDCGTCVNYEIITSSGNYLGGGISPGLMIRLESLHHYAGKLPITNPDDFSESYPGTNTVQSILGATMGGMIGEIDWMIEKYRKQFTPLNIILTGGDATRFDKYLKNQTFAQPNLALYGLLEILSYNLEKE